MMCTKERGKRSVNFTLWEYPQTFALTTASSQRQGRLPTKNTVSDSERFLWSSLEGEWESATAQSPWLSKCSPYERLRIKMAPKDGTCWLEGGQAVSIISDPFLQSKMTNQFRDIQKMMESRLFYKGMCFVRIKTTENVIDKKESYRGEHSKICSQNAAQREDI